VAEVDELSKQIGDLATKFNKFQIEMTDRLARIETKLEAKNGNGGGNGKITTLLIDIVKMIVAAAIGVLVGAKSLIS
jgi:phage host-nuclease inhibitor protein Gam